MRCSSLKTNSKSQGFNAVLETKDEDFSSAISGLSVITQSLAEAAAHLYRSALRVLSQALHILTEAFMTVAAWRVIRSIFTDDSARHRVRRGHGLLSLTEPLTEAIEDEVMLPYSTASLPAEVPRVDQRFRIHASDIQTTLRLCADRPSMGEWAGTWWTKGRSRTIFKSDIVPPPKEDADPDVDVDVPRGPAQQQPAQDGALGIFVLNSLPPFRISRPYVGEWAGTWWTNWSTKGRSRTMFKSDIMPPPKEDADPDVDVDVPRGPAQQQPAQDGALGIFVLNTAFSLVIPAVPHLTTISNATRGMASDPASIFADQGHETGRSPHNLRSSLSGTHRDEGIVFRDSTKE
ncbi:hypothetical protein B0H11DRAFT_2232278 [Mycena galericulata]|nr:hypothetical protein B0H11DRAFT_2232278 [Mycena galericulata]